MNNDVKLLILSLFFDFNLISYKIPTNLVLFKKIIPKRKHIQEVCSIFGILQ